ncbi:two-component regulator propeller domain-containing protein [Arcicella aquatica]|uniref:histidine kinase n=1 Tax=Arcicella aquatica TaxID=217141 RepID=A0ABU5QLI4_9BACT|nr:two-component regulator propeller domain-containing protein [Arcicella aquatica]MEA5257898.1 two-component regulator propeller domain-containing protein [Arcicella aquatica]
MKGHLKYIFLVIIIIPSLSLAQSNTAKFRFEHLTVNDGLPHSDAMFVVQDKSGFIWTGTNNGISRYDGYELKKYDMPVNPDNGLPSNRIHTLHVDAKGRLWIGAESAGVNLLDVKHDKVINVTQQANPAINQDLIKQLRVTNVVSIASDSLGRIWVGTSRNGIFVLKVNDDDQLESVQHIVINQKTAYKVASIICDKEGFVWIATRAEGLWYVSPKGSTIRRAALEGNYIRTIHIDFHGNLWVATYDQLLWISKAQRLTAKSSETMMGNLSQIECIYLDSFNQLWVGTNYGLRFWPAKTPILANTIPIDIDKPTTFLPLDGDQNSINSGRVHQVFEDNNQNIWLAASAGGLNRVNLRRKPFYNLQRQFSQHPTLPNNYINCIHKDVVKNWLWIGTRNGFSRYDFNTRTYQNFLSRDLPADATGVDVSAFYQNNDGTLWAGTRYLGLIKLNGDKSERFIQIDKDLTLYNTSIESIIEDRFGTIWLATFELGLIRLNKEGKLLEHYWGDKNPLKTNAFTFLMYDKTKDVLWASTRDIGLWKIQVKQEGIGLLKHFSYDRNNKNSLSGNYAWPTLKDKLGNVWVGTIGAGLNKISTNAEGEDIVQRINIPYPNIESLQDDAEGNLWIGGDGLLRYNTQKGQWLHYDVGDGLQSNSFKVGAATRDAEGLLYFGGIRGLTYFNPKEIRPNANPSVVRLTNFRIYNKPVQVGEEINGRVVLEKPLEQTQNITVKDRENDFSIGFVGLNYNNPQKNIYAYRLKGYNKNWVYTTANQRTASFSNLSAGDYVLEIKAYNGEGQWSKKPAILKIMVLPPWYKTWWAYTLYSLLIVSAFIVYRRASLARQALKNAIALEKFKAEKEKEITDLKLSFFTNVSHELRTPLTLILGPMEELVSVESKMKDKVVLMHQQTRKLLELVNQLLEFRKVESGHVSLRATQGNILHFIQEIFLIFKLKADECYFDYAISMPKEPINMYFDWSKLEIILTNLLSNSFKYTPEGGKIRIQVSVIGSPDEGAVFDQKKLKDNYLEIKVQDWGIGMKTDEVDKIFDPYFQASHTETMKIMGTGIGLSLVKQFVEAHSGEVSVQSQVGEGTTFQLKLPFGKAHLAIHEIQNEVLEPQKVTVNTNLVDVERPEAEKVSIKIPSTTRILIVEDNEELRLYLQQLCEINYEVFTAVDGLDGWGKTLQLLPDLVISDVMMPRSDGLELCRKIKQHPKTSHIPVMLLTARVAAVHELEGLETGADEYMAKPFNPLIFTAKIVTMLQSRLQLREYYQRKLLLEPTQVDIPDETKQLLEKAMAIIENNLSDSDFNVQILVREMGMSQSAFYRQIKAITGQSVVEFIRDIRLKRAAQLLSSGNLRVSEVAMMVGIEDIKYFRKMFQGIYNMPPSEYAKQHRSNS